MSVIIFDKETDQKLADLKAYAEENFFTKDQIQKRMTGEIPPPGDDPNYRAEFPVETKVVLTIEDHPQDDGTSKWLRHMTMTVKNKLPHPEAVKMVLPKLGFTSTLDEMAHVSREETPDTKAIRILEIIKQ